MRRQLRHVLSLLVLLLTSLATSVAGAATPAEAQQFVKDQQTLLAGLVGKGANAEVDRVFSNILDFDAISRDSLGEEWDGLTVEQRAEFQCVLRRLVATAYNRDLRRTLDYTITFSPPEVDAKGVRVKTTAKHKTDAHEDPVSIHYVVHRVGDRWRIRDIITDDVSMVETYQSQFRRLLKRKGYGEMIRKMREKAGLAPGDVCA